MRLTRLIVIILTVYPLWALSPVLLVPGDGGSILMAKYTKTPPHFICGRVGNWFILWLNVYYFTPVTLSCFTETIKLEYDPQYKTTSSPEFCETIVEGFGTSDSVEYFSSIRIHKTSYFHYVITELVNNHGYTPNKNIRGAPYDFRKGPNEMDEFQYDLRVLTEEMYLDNGNNPVVVMGHSMGNLYILRLLNSMSQKWKKKYIKSFISVSGPFTGAVDAIRTALSGNNEHIGILSKNQLREAQSTWPSTYFLMPRPRMWSSADVVLTDNENYTVDTIAELLIQSGIQFAEDHLKDVRGAMAAPVAPNVPVYCIYTDDLPTSEVLDYRQTNFPDDQPAIVFGAGDGTVNLSSLQHCSNWKHEQKESVETSIVPGVKHLEIMRDSRLVEIISEIILIANQK